MMQEQSLAVAVITQAIFDVELLKKVDRLKGIKPGDGIQLSIITGYCKPDSPEIRYLRIYHEAACAARFLMGTGYYRLTRDFWLNAAGTEKRKYHPQQIIGIYPEFMTLIARNEE